MKELEEEFADDLRDWKAEIDKKTLAVIFHEPETLLRFLSGILSQYIKYITRFFRAILMPY